MKITIAFLIIFCVNSSICYAQFISDKGELHVIAGAVTSATTYTIVYSTTKNKKKAFWYSLGASALVGIAKEVYDDAQVTNNPDSADILATVVGGITASLTLSLFVGKKKRKNKTVLVN